MEREDIELKRENKKNIQVFLSVFSFIHEELSV